MKQQIKESIQRMTKDDCQDVKETCKLTSSAKKVILKDALADEDIAEYVLMY